MKRLTSLPWGRIFFLLALLLQLWRTDHYFTWSGSDRNQQLVGALQIQRGEGFTVPRASTDDLSKVYSENLQGWPPGFRTCIRLIYALTGDWFLSSRIFNAIGVLLLFLSAHLLLNALKPYLDAWVYPGFFAFWTISYTPFHYTIAVEEWALACFLMLGWSLVRMLERETEAWFDLKMLGMLLLFIGLGTWFRYLYFPLILIPVSVLWLRYRKQKISLQRLGIDLLILGLAGLAILWLLKPSYTLGGHWWDTFLVDTWHPEHLLKMDAFPLKAWAYFGLEGMLNKWPELPVFVPPLLKTGLFLGSLVIFWSLWKGYRENEDFVWRQFQLACLVAAFGTVVLLVFQSLARAPEWHDGVLLWTYVQETRYYAPLLVAVQILGFARALSTPLPAWEKWFWRLLLIGAFAYAGIHSSYRALEGSARETRWAHSEIWLKESYGSVLSYTQSGEQVVWIHGSTIYEEDEAHLAALAGASMLLDQELDGDAFPCSTPVLLMTSISRVPLLKEAFLRDEWKVLAESPDRIRLSKAIKANL